MSDHQWTLEHLPWYVNGSLVGAQYERAHRHMSDCLICQREHREQMIIANAVAAPVPAGAEAAQALAALNEQLTAGTKDGWHAPRVLRRLVAFTPRPVRIAVVLQSLLLAVAGIALWQQQRDVQPVDAYRTLGETPAPAGGLRVVFVPDISRSDRDQLVREIGAVIADGPSERGVYTLTLDVDAVAIALVRDNPRVLFAEPVSRPSP